MGPVKPLLIAALAAVLLVPATATAGPVASNDGAYQVLGRVMPDPQGNPGGGCSGPCSPHAQGNLPATTFLGYKEFVDALKFMNDGSENAKTWQRYMEVWTLDGDLDGNDDANTNTDEKANFPGNNLGFWEFTPDGNFHSAGLPRPDLARVKSDIIVVRVTDENVPDAGKSRMALSLSIHGIERAGVEGGARAIEDLVTASTTDKLDTPILDVEKLGVPIPKIRDVLANTIIYFTFPNPDGWRRGDLNDQEKGPGVFFQRYNGNGVDLNRDYPDIGFSFRPYSSLSEPESQAWSTAFQQIKARGGPFAAGDDLHGQLGADSFSFTLMPHGSHDFAKNERIREAAQTINLVQQSWLSWSPLIQPNDQPRGSCNNKPVVGADCYPMYGQSWGTVYDTINYTTTGALGDFMDSSIGLNADGIDNEMSYSHLDKDIAFEPLIEQMHVDGNKGLIYAHLAQVLNDRTFIWPSRGKKGYVASNRVKRDRQASTITAPPGTHPQADIDADVPAPGGSVTWPFDPPVGGDGIYNGGMRVEVTTPNIQGINPAAQAGGHSLTLQCKFCDQHRGIAQEDEPEWITVAEDFNQSGIYLQAGLTVAVNKPQTVGVSGKPVEWRIQVSTGIGPAIHVHVVFSQGPATTAGATGGDAAPQLAGYDVAASDFWKKLEPFAPASAGFGEIDPVKLIKDPKDKQLDDLDTLVLTDQALPGYAFPPLAGVAVPPDVTAQSSQPTAPCGYTDGNPHTPGCYETFEFAVPKQIGRAVVSITPTSGDLTLTVYKKAADGTEEKVSATSDGGGDGGTETVAMAYPEPGDYIAYVDNWVAPGDSGWTGGVKFEAPSIGPQGTSKYSEAEWNTYVERLKSFVQGGGNLVLTDGALQALPYLFPAIKRVDVGRSISYVGQVAFTTKKTDSQDAPTDGNTLKDPLAKNVNQPGARFNTGLRRQTFEPTPVGFSIQNATDGGNEPHSPVWLVSRDAFEAAGGRITATGTSGEADLVTQVTVGELKMGKGVVRIVGALLPTPTEEFDHEQGLEPFAVTYTGYFLAENLTDWCAPGHSCPRVTALDDDASSSASACVAARGFTSASAKPRKRGLAFAFKRAGTAPVKIDLFQVSKGRRVVKQLLQRRFVTRKGLTWDGKKGRHKITNGYYFVRMSVKGPNGLFEGRRMALVRRNGRWHTQRSFYRRETCTRLRSFKLIRPVFGGSKRAGLGISFRVATREQVRVVVTRKGKTVKRYTFKRPKALTTIRRNVSPRKLRNGLYTVTITVGTGKGALKAKLYSKRI